MDGNLVLFKPMIWRRRKQHLKIKEQEKLIELKLNHGLLPMIVWNMDCVMKS